MVRVLKLVGLLCLVPLFSGCNSVTNSNTELRAKALMIEPGMSQPDVVAILGTPGDRQFHGDGEVWQYRSFGIWEEDITVIWFVDREVVGYTTESSKDLPFGVNYKPFNLERSQYFISDASDG